MSTIAIKNWERFQHYKDRDPPWIKLYRDLLTSESWVLGTDTSRLLQVAITLLAARYQNATPLNFGLLKKVTSVDCTKIQFDKAIEHLESTNFLEIQGRHSALNGVAQSASTLLATCPSEAEQSRKDLEAEQRQSRGDARGDARAKRSPATRLPEDFALTDERRAYAQSHAVDADAAFALFSTYWRAKSGQGATKVDWDATWQHWVLKDAKAAKPRKTRFQEIQDMRNAGRE